MSVGFPDQKADSAAAPVPVSQRYAAVRALTARLIEPLSPEDCTPQSMPDCSPAKWHLAHTTWFFETFLLIEELPEYRPFHSKFGYLFNSYYNAVGERHPRPKRGLLTRPTLNEVLEYRQYVDEAMQQLFERELSSQTMAVVEVGLHHEQQHQELLITDMKHLLFCNPLRPAYQHRQASPVADAPLSLEFLEFSVGLHHFGADGLTFCYDNETPRHQRFVQPFPIANRLVTAGEWLAFIEDDGYSKPELWLSEGWASVQAEGWHAPLYWERHDGRWRQFTLSGERDLAFNEPVCHVSFYEADAFARWSNCRLPTEFEWEHACGDRPVTGNRLDDMTLHPTAAASNGDDLRQMYGDVWEWTASPYVGYPGYQPPAGALGEYNGKFMSNQMVLRGGSCATPVGHLRSTYRNFFPPHARWQFMGLRLAKDVS